MFMSLGVHPVQVYQREVPKSVTSNDLERHNGCKLRYYTEFVTFER